MSEQHSMQLSMAPPAYGWLCTGWASPGVPCRLHGHARLDWPGVTYQDCRAAARRDFDAAHEAVTAC